MTDDWEITNVFNPANSWIEEYFKDIDPVDGLPLSEKENKPHKCYCTITALMQAGCQCEGV